MVSFLGKQRAKLGLLSARVLSGLDEKLASDYNIALLEKH
jgi:hypothetical protein